MNTLGVSGSYLDVIYLFQLDAARWVSQCLGTAALFNRKERALRLLEEALELAQAEGIEPMMVEKLFRHVYAKPKGDPRQEAAGVGTCLFSWAIAAGERLGHVIFEELERVSDPVVMENVRIKNMEKRRTGLSFLPLDGQKT